MQNEPCCAIQSIDVVVVVRYTKVCPFMVSFICFFLELTDLLKSMYKNIIHIDKNNNLSVTPNFNHIHLMHGLERLPLAHIYTITPQFQYVFLPRLVDVIRLLYIWKIALTDSNCANTILSVTSNMQERCITNCIILLEDETNTGIKTRVRWNWASFAEVGAWSARWQQKMSLHIKNFPHTSTYAN